MALLVVQGVSLLVAVVVLAATTGGRLGYDAAMGLTPTYTLEGWSGF